MEQLTLNKSGYHISREEEILYATNKLAKPEESNDVKLMKHFFDTISAFNIHGWEYFKNELEFE